MIIINWIYFIISVILVGISITVVILSLFGSDKDDEIAVMGAVMNFCSNGLFTYTSFCLFKPSLVYLLLGVIWGASTVIYASSLFLFIKNKSSISLKLSMVAILLLTIVFYSLMPRDINNYIVLDRFLEDRPNISVIIQLFIIILFVFLLSYLLYFAIHNLSEKSKIFKNSDGINKALIRDDLQGSPNENAIVKLYQVYQNLSKDGHSYKNSSDILSYFIDDLQVSTYDAKRIQRAIERSFVFHEKLTLSEFKDLVLSSFAHNNSPSSFETNFILDDLVERTQITIRKELKRINQIDNSVVQEIKNDLDEIKKQLPISVSSIGGESITEKMLVNNSDTYLRDFIRDLCHSLISPISQIDTSQVIIEEKMDKSDSILNDSVDAIGQGVKLLYSFLYGYRQVATAAFTNTLEDKFTIKEGINSARIIYQHLYNKVIIFEELNLPDTIEGFSSYFILSIILPLLENAIYASNDNQTIEIEYLEKPQDNIFIIRNPLNEEIDIKNLYKDGYSSKMENGKQHEGRGLLSVRNLINNVDGSNLSFNLIENNSKLETILTIHISK